MKKVALVFVLAVFVPSLVLAWLAFRSLSDQQFVLERRTSLLYQGVADTFAKEAADFLAEELRGFGTEVEAMLAREKGAPLGPNFDAQLRERWPLAEIGFVVSPSSTLVCPTTSSGPTARTFVAGNGRFLCNQEPAEVYWNAGNTTKGSLNNIQNFEQTPQVANFTANQAPEISVTNSFLGQKFAQNKLSQQQRIVVPQQSGQNFNGYVNFDKQVAQALNDNRSRLNPEECEFRQLIGDATQGTVARFVDNRLTLLFWHSSERAPGTVYGAQISLTKLKSHLREILDKLDAQLHEEICVALLDDTAKPIGVSHPQFQGNWKRPFVATEIGEALPHWEMAVYMLNPAKLTQTANTARLTLGLLIGVLVLAIGIGSWLIVADLNRQLTLARQKTDFVSNVSHELKTPLTSIRMFSELLAEDRVREPAKQKSYLHIITAETARLTRLINNVLDFSRMERGEKKYNFQDCDLAAIVRETVETYRPHLENNGFQLTSQLPTAPLVVRGDADALAQIIVNLLSNAEKYSNGEKEIEVHASHRDTPLPHIEIEVLDRGPGVPPGCEEKIFEQFYRAHDCLSSGIQGSGLGLSLARQIARAHGGDVRYESRDGGGSCFALRLPQNSVAADVRRL
jgi:signal transduction histidine kinase